MHTTSNETLRPFETGGKLVPEVPDELELIDTETACAIVGGNNKPVHRSTLWRLVKAGKLPPPNKKLRRWERRSFIEAVRAILATEAA